MKNGSILFPLPVKKTYLEIPFTEILEKNNLKVKSSALEGIFIKSAKIEKKRSMAWKVHSEVQVTSSASNSSSNNSMINNNSMNNNSMNNNNTNIPRKPSSSPPPPPTKAPPPPPTKLPPKIPTIAARTNKLMSRMNINKTTIKTTTTVTSNNKTNNNNPIIAMRDLFIPGKHPWKCSDSQYWKAWHELVAGAKDHGIVALKPQYLAKVIIYLLFII